MPAEITSGLNDQSKIITLWISFQLGMLFHTQLALMPLFHGIDVAESHTHEHLPLNVIFGFMLLVFALPLCAGTALTDTKRYRVLHFGLTIVFTVSDFFHFWADVAVAAPGYQLCLMGLLSWIGLGLLDWIGVKCRGLPVDAIGHMAARPSAACLACNCLT